MQGNTKQMERMLDWFKPDEILKMTTGNTGERMSLSGLRNPYPAGDLGVLAEGSYAGILLVEGNPPKDSTAVTDTDNLKIIMKGGKVIKNTFN